MGVYFYEPDFDEKTHIVKVLPSHPYKKDFHDLTLYYFIALLHQRFTTLTL